MPRGIPNKSAAPAVVPVPEEPAPMIFIEPARDGSIQLNAYGLYAGEVLDTLRRALIHLHAQRAGVQVISLEVPPAAAVVPANKPAASKPKPASRNGRAAERSALDDPTVPRYSDEDEE